MTEAVVKAEQVKLTETAKFIVVKPLDPGASWDALGRKLRALALPLPRIINATITDLELAHRSGRVSQKKGDGGTHPQTLADQFAKAAWDAEVLAARARIDSGKPWKLDDMILEHQPNSRVYNAAGAAAYARWAKFAKDRWTGASSLPSFRKGAPIFVKGAGLALTADDRGAILTVKLTRDLARKGNVSTVDTLAVRPGGPKDHRLLRLVLDGKGKVGDARIKWEPSRGGEPGKWVANVSITHEIEQRSGGRTMALHRGVTTFLAYAIASDAKRRSGEAGILEDGAKIRAHKDAYKARRRDLGRTGKSLGKGAKGRGRARRFARITALEDAESRWVRTKCQETAAHAMKVAVRAGVTRVVIEDWTNPAKDGAAELGAWMERVVRTFPLAELREALKWAARKRGIEVAVRSGAYQSCTCPRCGHVNDADLGKPGRFECGNTRCLFVRSREVVAAIHLLKADGAPFDTDDLVKATRRVMDAFVPEAAE